LIILFLNIELAFIYYVEEFYEKYFGSQVTSNLSAALPNVVKLCAFSLTIPTTNASVVQIFLALKEVNG
jgi:hypothetical protein